MKNILSVLLLILLVTNLNSPVCGQSNQKNEIDVKKWYSYKKINDNIYQINDHGLANIYLVIGKDSVLIVDTGMGIGNLKQYVRTLTKLPMIVVNTHGHDDHSGGNNQFKKVYAGSDDFELIRKPRVKEYVDKFIHNFLPDITKFPPLRKFNNHAELIPIKNGHVFDLGNRKVEVIEIPGHTKGSISLLDQTSGVLITGDNNNSQTWLFLDICMPIEVYKKSLEKLIERKKEITLLLPGHGDAYDTDFLDEHLSCVNNILGGNCDPIDITTFAGNGRLCIYKRANIVFNPYNLFVVK